ncbi:hypothetical protein Patl1_03957 [Pistacia atlantica]|uniref:Uncharacterized protein n=1 Tax=Pistacia atlantica TaxID=434234 RepID=A0ACC1BST9_9ROSI|nr:hypothetical protein Patl1_03957 [Pistacia atlantica]
MAPVNPTGAIVAAAAISIAIASYYYLSKSNKKTNLSEATGCEILGKCEFLNPGGSVKDRVAVKIIEEALEAGKLSRGGVVTEGSAGSTAISLATVAPTYGCKCHVVIPDDAAIEKSQILEALGAIVERVRPVSITHRDHYVNIARRRALEANEFASKHRKGDQVNGKELEQINGHGSDEAKKSSIFSSDCTGGFFADQFENLANFRAHYEGTGPEIWEQTSGHLDAFVAAAGTGGTVAGVSRFLQVKFFPTLHLLFIYNWDVTEILYLLTGKESRHQVLPG